MRVWWPGDNKGLLRRQNKCHNNKHGLHHFSVPTGGANATRKMFLREPLDLGEPTW